MKQVIIGILVFSLIVALTFGAWHLKRWFNYSYGYESQVQEQITREITPLVKRIEALEAKK